MQDFFDFANNQKNNSNSNQNNPNNIFDTIKNLAGKFDGKSQNELLEAIYQEALKGKRNGTLTNAEIDRFGAMLAPMLDEKKRKILEKVIKELKKI